MVGPGTLRPDQPAPGADCPARGLIALGDLPDASLDVDSVYDGALVAEILRFQDRHGLSADGITVHGELPKLRRDPGRLATRRFEIVAGETMLPATAASVEALAQSRARLRQRPGPGNALGRVKFLFPNSHSVYLHDTPSRDLFARSRRNFRHGCIRVERPAELAEWVLREQPDWPPERIRTAMAGTHETFVRVAPPVAVVIAYASAIARRDGTISFYDDLYGHDAALERALAARDS